jgi:hypothetical protein
LVTIRLRAACRNTSVSLTTGTAPEAITSARTCPGPTEGSWSTSPTSSSAARPGTALSSACISGTSTMLVSSTTSRSHSSGRSSVALEAAVRRVGLEQAVDRAGAQARALASRLAGPPGRRRERHLDALRDQHLQDRVHERGLAHPRPAGDHQHLRAQRQAQSLPLARGQGQPRPLLHPGHGLVDVDRGPRRRACASRQQPLGDAALGPVQAGQEHAGPPVHLVGHDVPARQLERERLVHDLGRDLEQPAAEARSSSAGRPQWPSSIASASAKETPPAPGSWPSSRCRASPPRRPRS